MFDETLDRYLREIALHQELLWKNSLYRKTIVFNFFYRNYENDTLK